MSTPSPIKESSSTTTSISSAPEKTSTSTTTIQPTTTTSIPISVLTINVESSALAKHKDSSSITDAIALDVANKLNIASSQVSISLIVVSSNTDDDKIQIIAKVQDVSLQTVEQVSASLNATKQNDWMSQTVSALRSEGETNPQISVVSSAAAADNDDNNISPTPVPPSDFLSKSKDFCSENLAVCVGAPIGGFVAIVFSILMYKRRKNAVELVQSVVKWITCLKIG